MDTFVAKYELDAVSSGREPSVWHTRDEVARSHALTPAEAQTSGKQSYIKETMPNAVMRTHKSRLGPRHRWHPAAQTKTAETRNLSRKLRVLLRYWMGPAVQTLIVLFQSLRGNATHCGCTITFMGSSSAPEVQSGLVCCRFGLVRSTRVDTRAIWRAAIVAVDCKLSRDASISTLWLK